MTSQPALSTRPSSRGDATDDRTIPNLTPLLHNYSATPALAANAVHVIAGRKDAQ